MARLRDPLAPVLEKERPGSMGVPQLKKWPRAEPSHPPTSPPTLSCNTQTHCPLLSACSQQPYKDFNPVSTQAEWGSFGPGEPIGAPAPSVKTESQARGGAGAGHGCWRHQSCLHRFLRLWDCPVATRWRGKACADPGGRGRAWLCCPLALWLEQHSPVSSPGVNCASELAA